MNLLLDSHVAFWWATEEEELSLAASAAVDGAESLSISLASPWELQIKVKAGKLDLGNADWRQVEAAGVTFLAPNLDEVLLAANLPLHHHDPFDRLIIAQALNRALVVVTRDAVFSRYGVPVIAA